MRKTLVGVAIGVGAAAVILLVSISGALEPAELELYDWRVRTAARTATPHPDIVLVEIDDQSLRDAEPLFGRWPWPRVAYSILFDYLHRAPARVIAFDVGLWERDRQGIEINGVRWSGEESDAALAESVRTAGNVILLGDAVFAGSADAQSNKPPEWRDPGYRLGPAIEARPMLLAPFQSLADASAAVAHNFLPLDPDGTARRMPPFIQVAGRYVPSLGIAAGLRGGGFEPSDVSLGPSGIRVRDKVIPLVATSVRDGSGSDAAHDQLAMLVNYRTGARGTPGAAAYATHRANFLMQSEHQLKMGEKPEVDPALFKDKIVFIGTSASGAHDVFQSPFGEASIPGIQIHASMADSLLSGRFIARAPDATRIAAVVLGGVAVGILTVITPFGVAALGAAILGGAWTTVSVLAFKGGIWLNLSEPLAGIALTLFAGTTYRYFVEDREKRKVQKLFGRYVSKDVYQQLLAHPDRAELGGARREMTVLFSDIRGFTSVTENGQPEALVAQLNEYFSSMVDIVFRHKGTVDKFVGDMVMALFGAPLDDPAHAEHAVAAAVEMVRELGVMNRRWAAEGRPRLDLGIGVNSGEMIAGNIGSSSIMSYTVIGDNVNLGARLESLNKDYGTRIIISDATLSRLTGVYDIRSLGDVVVKGKTRPVAIHEVRVPSPLPATEEEHV